MTVHVAVDGRAKCGAKSHGFYSRVGLYLADETRPATCKRCLGQTRKAPVVVAPPEDWQNLVFHRQYGYDMTINVFCRPTKRTAKGLICQEITTKQISGDGFTGRVAAGDSFRDTDPFIMFCKEHHDGYRSWVGDGCGWSIVEEAETFYENHMD